MSEGPQTFRPVPRTGVIYVMTEAAKRGFSYGNPAWCNLGQGAPETGALEGAPERLTSLELRPGDLEYGPVAGLHELRAAVAELYNRRYRKDRASKYSAENVAIASGGRLALTRLATALGRINLGHQLPDYTAYEELLTAFGSFVPIPVSVTAQEGFRLDPQRLKKAIAESGLGAFLLSNPCNPTGRHIYGEDLRQCVGVARETGCALILDEFYAHYSYRARPNEASAAAFVDDVDRDPVVVLDGLTKNWRYPGLRLSWTLGPRDLIERLGSAGSFLDGGPPPAVQRVALGLVQEEEAEAEAAAIRKNFIGKRDMMVAELEGMGIEVPAPPEGAFYCFGDLSKLPAPFNDGMELFRAGLDRQIICVPGVFFDVDPGGRRRHIPSRLRQFVRFSFGPERSQLERGLARLREMVS